MLVSHLLLSCDVPIGRVIRRMEPERSSQYRFPCMASTGGSGAGNLGDGPTAGRLHPVLLRSGLEAVGREGAGLALG